MTLPVTAEIIVIGAGTAGLAAVKQVQKQTDDFLLINAGEYGTTCARVGCMPSKLLIEAANAYHRRHCFDTFGIRHAESLAIDLPAVFSRVRELRDYYVSGVMKSVHALGNKVVTGRAKLQSYNQVQVNDQIIQCKKIIIATGSTPIVPENWKTSGNKLLTTDSLFEQSDLKSRIAVIGMGAIGIEMAQALSRLGINITAFSSTQQLAGLTDPEVNQSIHHLLQVEFPIYSGDKAELSETANGVLVSAGKVSVEVDQVIAAIGRQANLKHIGLECLGVPLNDEGIPEINPHTMQVADLPVFIAGDASSLNMVLHEVADEGRIAGHNAVSASIEHFCRRTPMRIVFTDPEIACVGMTYEQCNEANTLIGQALFEDQGRARAGQQNKGVMRLYADRNNGRLIGAEMATPAAEHMAHVLALAIEQQLTIAQILAMPIYHPVLEEGMRTALRQLQKQLPTDKAFDLSRCEAFHSEALD
ncbi:dihydrolipoyl dehydrogenase [Methylophaga thiooxydans]|uniref:dihydrolipoyl dehydrogenase n=1 Tax=Methylophaga thiooxydans TaxID=392484 RepID=UPI0023542804|nr:dihydrolipoyl dehydrogenase [Methylophaga thiooxydans]